MFDREKSKNFIKATMGDINFKKKGSWLFTGALITLLAQPPSALSFEDTIVWEKKMEDYTKKMYQDKNTYDNNITNLFNNGLLVYNNKKIEIKGLFLVYGNKDNEFKAYLVDTKQGFFDLLTGGNIDFERHGAVRFRDTTAFINLLNNKAIQIVGNSLIILDTIKIQEILDNWDGYIHSEVKETNNAFNKQIVDRNKDEKRK